MKTHNRCFFKTRDGEPCRLTPSGNLVTYLRELPKTEATSATTPGNLGLRFSRRIYRKDGTEETTHHRATHKQHIALKTSRIYGRRGTLTAQIFTRSLMGCIPVFGRE